jgi:streptogramin lyase
MPHFPFWTFLALGLGSALEAQAPPVLTGAVVDGSGRPLPGVVVAAGRTGSPVRHGTVTDASGRFAIQVADRADYQVAVADSRFEGGAETARSSAGTIQLRATAKAAPSHPSSSWLNGLPEGREKRWFILDCTGCHQFNETRALRDGTPRSAAQWRDDVTRMVRQFGSQSGFPIIGDAPDKLGLVDWVARHNRGAPVPVVRPPGTTRYTITEYDLPGPDLPHDVAVDSTGKIVVTGMFTHRLLTLDPATGATTVIAIPVPGANPRAIEVDRAGDWWVLLGGPGKVGRYRPGTNAWAFADVGMYAHSIGIGQDGGVWANHHFANDSIRLAVVAERGGTLTATHVRGPLVKGDALGPSPIPYELRVGPNGVVWMSLLHGNAMVSFDPATRRFDSIPMPEPDAGPRRFDIGPDGVLWIPAYSGSALFRLDPATRRFDRFELPIGSSLPYVARVHPRTGDIWVGTGAPDVVYRFSPRTRSFETLPVLTRGASMRHMAIDPRSGDIWIAYGASPAIHPTRVARIQTQ